MNQIWGKCNIYDNNTKKSYHDNKIITINFSFLTVTSETSQSFRLVISLCAFHETFLSLMPVLILTVSGISKTFKKNNSQSQSTYE